MSQPPAATIIEHFADLDDSRRYNKRHLLIDIMVIAICAVIEWIKAVHEITDGQIVSIDGKMLRRSHDKTLGKKAIHTVSAWAVENQLVLGQVNYPAASCGASNTNCPLKDRVFILAHAVYQGALSPRPLHMRCNERIAPTCR